MTRYLIFCSLLAAITAASVVDGYCGPSDIAAYLVKAGLVRSIRGAGGGFALVKDPAQISVLEIIEAIEGKIVFQRCKQLKPDCEHTDGCALCGLFEQAQDGVKDVLLRTTLVDLIQRQETIELTRGRKSQTN